MYYTSFLYAILRKQTHKSHNCLKDTDEVGVPTSVLQFQIWKLISELSSFQLQKFKKWYWGELNSVTDSVGRYG